LHGFAFTVLLCIQGRKNEAKGGVRWSANMKKDKHNRSSRQESSLPDRGAYFQGSLPRTASGEYTDILGHNVARGGYKGYLAEV
jgi:hypothetical protein